MREYQFQMANDKTHASVIEGGAVIGTIQNNPEYLGGSLNFSQDSTKHGNPLPKVDDGMWDAFYDWVDSLAAPSAAAVQLDAAEDQQ